MNEKPSLMTTNIRRAECSIPARNRRFQISMISATIGSAARRPASCGETSYRPGRISSISRLRSSSGKISRISPPRTAGLRYLPTSETGIVFATIDFRSRTSFRLRGTLAAALSSASSDCTRIFIVSPSRSASTETITGVPGSRSSRLAASVSEKITASNCPVASENVANANLLPF